jgi:hypothetical protein
MKKLMIIIIATLYVVISGGCEKEPELPPEQLLTSLKGWIQTAQTISPARLINDIMVTDYYNQVLPDCKKNDILYFTSTSTGLLNGQYNIQEGSTRCNISDPTTVDTGTWTLNAAKTSIEFKSNAPAAVPYTYTIVELSSKIFKSTRVELDNTTSYTYTITYVPTK